MFKSKFEVNLDEKVSLFFWIILEEKNNCMGFIFKEIYFLEEKVGIGFTLKKLYFGVNLDLKKYYVWGLFWKKIWYRIYVY